MNAPAQRTRNRRLSALALAAVSVLWWSPAVAAGGLDTGVDVTVDAELLTAWRASILDRQGQDAGRPAESGSRWYLQRSAGTAQPGPLDAVPEVAFRLASLMRDGGVPGFYDGQFASTADDFEGLARLVADRDVHHVLRFVAIMALQESKGSNAQVEQVLTPLVMLPQVEYQIELDHFDFLTSFEDVPPDFIPHLLDAQLSRYGRFALAKRGMPALIKEKIVVMEHFVDQKKRSLPRWPVSRRPNRQSDWIKETWFNIGYYYQQFDDYENAARWFRSLTEAFPRDRSTRWAHYNLACIEALQGRPAEAVVELRHAYEAGFLDLAWMQEDGDLTSLRDREDYQQLHQEMAVGTTEAPPPTGGNSTSSRLSVIEVLTVTEGLSATDALSTAEDPSSPDG